MSLWTGTAVVAVMQYTRYGVWPLPKASVCAGQLQMDACCVPCSAQFCSIRALQLTAVHEVSLVFGLCSN